MRESWKKDFNLEIQIIVLYLLAILFILKIDIVGAETQLKSLDEIIKTSEKFDVSGQVIDKNNQAIGDAEIFLYYARGSCGLRDRLVVKTRTASDGKFKFEKAIVWEPRTETKTRYHTPAYGVIAKHPECGINFAVILQGDKSDNVIITLDKPNFVDVTVKDPEDKPIEGAKIIICDGKNPNKDLDSDHRYIRLNQDIGLSSTVTDKEGKARLMGFQEEPTFWVDKEGYVRGWAEQSVILFPSAQISGKVTYEDGSQAEGMAVWFTYHGNGLIYEDVTTTDKNGDYIFKDVPGAEFRYTFMDKNSEKGAAGRAELLVEDLRPGSNFVSKLEQFITKPGDKITKDIKLTKGVIISGKVVDLITGKPIPHMVIRRGFGGDSGQIETDDNGGFYAIISPNIEVWFQWDRSKTGEHIIDQKWLSDGNHLPFRGIVKENMTDLVFKLKVWQTNELTGRVVNEKDEGVKDAKVYVHMDVPGVKTDESGKFIIKVAPKDRDFKLFALTEDKKFAGLVSLKAGATEAEIKLEPIQTYKGEVVDTGGQPAPNLKFYFDLKMNDSTIFQAREEPQADTKGKFTVNNLLPTATYYAWWRGDNETNRDYDYGNATIDLTQIKAGEPIHFEAKRYINAFMGKVVNKKGEPIKGATIQVASWDMSPQDIRNQTVRSDKEGEFVINRLAYGEVSLIISAVTYKSKTVKAPSDSIDYEVVLNPASEGTSYKVIVVDEENKPIADTSLALKMTLYNKYSEEKKEILTGKTDAEGKYEFLFKPSGDIANGRGIIKCDLKGFDLSYYGVNLNEDADIKLVMKKGKEYWTGQVLDKDSKKPIREARIEVANIQCDVKADYRTFAHLKDEPNVIFKTDKNGKFQLRRINKKDGILIIISASGYIKVSEWFSLKQPVKDIFYLSPGGIIKGKLVLKETGKPLKAKAQISLVSSEGIVYDYVVSEDGTFNADDMEPGEYKIFYNFNNLQDRKYVCNNILTINVRAGETKNLTIEFEVGTLIKGKIIDSQNNKVPENMMIYTYLESKQPIFTKVNNDGSWEVYLPEWDYSIYYTLPNQTRFEPKLAKKIKVEKGKTYEDIIIKINQEEKQEKEEK